MVDESANGSGKADGVGMKPGDKIGKYEVVARVAIGGQAIIYKCYDNDLDREVAIKQLSTHLAEDARFMDRFRKEAQILAQLGADQPEIVTVHDLLEDERGLFIVMEFVRGNSVEATLGNNPGPVEVRATLQILWRLCGALHAVHNAGIVHRDIKPSNIIIGEGLRTTITDFGVAAGMSGQTSMRFGTTKYMAPELFSLESGEAVDGRADIYSLGMVMYEMLLGRAKFNEVFADVVRDKQTESLRWMKWHSNTSVAAPMLHKLNPNVPLSLSSVVATMMAKNPNERIKSVEQLGKIVKKSFGSVARQGHGDESGKFAEPTPVTPATSAPRPGGNLSQRPEELSGEMVFSEEAPTMAIPKKQMSRRTKITILASVMGVLLVALIAVGVMHWQYNVGRERAATRNFKAALDTYAKGDSYLQAKDMFQRVKDRFPHVPHMDRTSVFIHLCAAYAAVDIGRWDLANAEEKNAIKSLKLLESKYDSKEFKQWERRRDNDIEKLSYFIQAVQDYDDAIWRAQQNMKDGNPAEAMAIVIDIEGVEKLGESRRKEFVAFRTKIERTVITDKAEALIESASLMAARQPAEARVKCLAAQRALDGKEGKVLDPKVRVGLRDRVDKVLANIETSVSIEQVKQSVENARKSGDSEGLLSALQAAVDFKPMPASLRRKYAAEVVNLEEKNAFAKITGFVSQGQRTTAIRRLGEFCKKYPKNTRAATLLGALKEQRRFNDLKAEGMHLREQRKWSKAAALLGQAARLSRDAEVDTALRECTYRLEMAKLHAFIREEKFIEAEAAAERARDIWPDRWSVEIERIVLDMRAKKRVSEMLAKAAKSISDGKYTEAQRDLKPLQGSNPKADRMINRAIYLKNLEKGDEAMKAKEPNYKAALSLFKIAKQYAKSSEEIKEITAKIDYAQNILDAAK